jgi:serine/threonine protein kinase
MHEWQTTHHPMCNYLHELDFHTNFRTGDLEYIDSGGFNDLFHYVTHETYHDIIMERDIDGNLTSVLESTKEFAIKILSLETKAYTPHNYQIVRQDAVIQERLTASSYIFPIYGYCGFALVLPFVSGGTLSSNLRKWRKGTLEISSKQRLRYAVEMARGLRDLHDIDGDGVPSVTHGDLKEQQYLVTEDGGLQLGDFNKGQFLTKHESTGETCPYVNSRGQNDKVFRSPEEYAYKPQDAASDVWALGSLMYYLLTGARVWRDLADKHTDRVRRYIIEGKRPEIDERILKSKDPVDQALKKAYDMACVYNIEERASAKEVSAFLDAVWEELGY